MSEINFTAEEKVITEAILDARKVQEYLWGELSICDTKSNVWGQVFQKRVDKIMEIDHRSPSARVELRKRVLQQAALSIKLLMMIDSEESLERKYPLIAEEINKC